MTALRRRKTHRDAREAIVKTKAWVAFRKAARAFIEAEDVMFRNSGSDVPPDARLIVMDEGRMLDAFLQVMNVYEKLSPDGKPLEQPETSSLKILFGHAAGQEVAYASNSALENTAQYLRELFYKRPETYEKYAKTNAELLHAIDKELEYRAATEEERESRYY